jgi:hypothetical protein
MEIPACSRRSNRWESPETIWLVLTTARITEGSAKPGRPRQ